MGVEKKIIKAGNGVDFPKPNDEVTMHYAGTLTNGTLYKALLPSNCLLLKAIFTDYCYTLRFDSSVERNRPFITKIGAGKVIKGESPYRLHQAEIPRPPNCNLFTLPPSLFKLEEARTQLNWF